MLGEKKQQTQAESLMTHPIRGLVDYFGTLHLQVSLTMGGGLEQDL